ncbi:MAG: NUDIX hydrolase [Gammaproteobacteria bacterium]|nr:NUDIX hydrolase [Gammaproteobacteria bacterium]
MKPLLANDARHWLLSRLETYLSRWPQESAPTAVKQFVLHQPRCFERDCFDDGHLTGSAWVVSPDRSRVLLTHHRKLDKWLQLGGHSDGDSNVLQVAMREAEEESGLRVEVVDELIFDVDVHRIPAHGVDPAHLHYDIRFLLSADDEASFAISDESNDLRWVALEKLRALTEEESMLRMWRKLQGQIGD